MGGNEEGKIARAGRIPDARGRTVTQLDPVTLHALHEHDVIDADTLAAIAAERGVRIRALEKTWLFAVFTFVLPFLGISLFTYEVITGDIKDGPYARFAGMCFLCSVPWITWYNLKRARQQNITGAMLKHARCPHCGQDLRGVPPDESDNATVCTKCGCAWKLNKQAAT